ncbi:helix-turn-helix domain-containing protein [Zooshikella harenae]|uniref:Helix-turn-helix transcriptional regulator n=1 Tax=Zooshikella harenae TaxID=2827238 RepID=A0ABS5ZI56_9GAMM|nr:AraC family transcriptional regulator [Zooshikella harenae]MBU2713654.1 helix-turn-helix transcriptional regulator [Zooshikella harenae]
MHPQHSICLEHHTIEKISPEIHGSQTENILVIVKTGHLKMHHIELIELAPNMGLLIPSGAPHSILEGENLDIWTIGFCPSCLNLNENSPLMHSFRQVRLGALPVFKINEQRMFYVTMLLEELQKELKIAQIDYTEVVKSILLLILNEVKKAIPEDNDTSSYSNKIVNALDYIQHNYLSAISLRDVALATHTSPSHLATLFRKNTGYSIGEWIIRCRLTESCSRLLHSSTPINLIVEELGWSDPTHFIRQFKKTYGITPAAWRRKHQATL